MHMFGLWEEARHAGTGRKCKVHTERPEDQLINQYVFLKDLLKMHNNKLYFLYSKLTLIPYF